MQLGTLGTAWNCQTKGDHEAVSAVSDAVCESGHDDLQAKDAFETGASKEMTSVGERCDGHDGESASGWQAESGKDDKCSSIEFCTLGSLLHRRHQVTPAKNHV
jgi:hypothetical protein